MDKTRNYEKRESKRKEQIMDETKKYKGDRKLKKDTDNGSNKELWRDRE